MNPIIQVAIWKVEGSSIYAFPWYLKNKTQVKCTTEDISMHFDDTLTADDNADGTPAPSRRDFSTDALLATTVVAVNGDDSSESSSDETDDDEKEEDEDDDYGTGVEDSSSRGSSGRSKDETSETVRNATADMTLRFKAIDMSNEFNFSLK